jgi:hypothetical protein
MFFLKKKNRVGNKGTNLCREGEGKNAGAKYKREE